MDLCGAMRVETVNGKRYILVIVDGYSRYTQVYFPRTKDKTLKMVIKFITQIQRNIKVQVLKVRSDNETEFKNEKLRSYYEKLGIMHQASIARMPQHNEEPIANEPTTPVFDKNFDEQVLEDVAELDVNTFMNPFATPIFEEAESSSNYQDPSNMNEFHQQHRFTDRWTKNHPIEQVIVDPSKPITTRSRLHTDVEICMYALTVSTTEPTNIKKAMLDHSWIESMQDELNQFKRLDVWELVERPTDRNVVKVKWLWESKTDAKNTVIWNKSHLIAKGYSQQEEIDFEESFALAVRLKAVRMFMA
ncbi:retrovirus-related pol polyprotein from transposon TNT 1-94 [Tanacetum coccineum]